MEAPVIGGRLQFENNQGLLKSSTRQVSCYVCLQIIPYD